MAAIGLGGSVSQPKAQTHGRAKKGRNRTPGHNPRRSDNGTHLKHRFLNLRLNPRTKSNTKKKQEALPAWRGIDIACLGLLARLKTLNPKPFEFGAGGPELNRLGNSRV